MGEVEEDLRNVKALIAKCSKCGGTVKTAVKSAIDKSTAREFGKLIEDGCDIYTTNVIIVAHSKWCEPPCEGMWTKKLKK